MGRGRMETLNGRGEGNRDGRGKWSGEGRRKEVSFWITNILLL